MASESKVYTVGVRNLVVTPITADSVSGISYGTPKDVVGVNSASWNLNLEVYEHRGDDQLLEVSQVVDKITIEMKTVGMDLELMSILTGGTWDTCNNGAFCHDLQNVAAYYQVEFEAVCTDGAILKILLAKAKISAGPSVEHADKTVGESTFSVTGVPPKYKDGVSKGFSIRRVE